MGILDSVGQAAAQSEGEGHARRGRDPAKMRGPRSVRSLAFGVFCIVLIVLNDAEEAVALNDEALSGQTAEHVNAPIVNAVQGLGMIPVAGKVPIEVAGGQMAAGEVKPAGAAIAAPTPALAET